MSFETDSVSLCYRSGFLGWLLLMFAKYSALTAWAGLTWFALHSKELFFLFLSQTYWFSIVAQYIVASYMLDVDPPNPSCNNNVLSTPPLVIWLLYHYISMAIVFELLERMPNSIYGWLQRVALGLGIPAIWVYSGNSTILNALYAALIGSAIGVMFTVDAYIFWDSRRKTICTWFPFTWFGFVYHPSIHDSYTVSTSKATRKVFF